MILDAILALKREYKITDKQVARVLGTADSSIRRWRCGHDVPRCMTLAMETIAMLPKSKVRRLIQERT